MQKTVEHAEINKRIAELISHLALSQTAFAKSLGTTTSRITNITQGRNKPDSQLLALIADKYPQVDMNWLLTGKGSANRNVSFPGTILSEDYIQTSVKDTQVNAHQTHRSAPVTSENTNARVEDDSQRSQELKALWSTLVQKERLDLVGVHYASFTSILGIYSDRVLAYVADKVEGQLNSILGEHLDKSIDTQEARTKLRKAVAPLNALQDKILAVDHAIYDMMEHVFKAYPDAMELVKGTVIPVHMMPVTDEMLKGWAEEAEKNREENARLAV